MNNELLLKLVDEFGAPIFIYDTDIIKRQYDRFVNAFSVKNLEVHYACKALTNINILAYFKSLGSKLECVSVQEVLLGLHAGFEANEIMYTPNGTSKAEFEKVISQGVNVNVDNLETVDYIGQNHKDLPISIRIKPHLMAGANKKISVGHEHSKFGISIKEIDLLLDLVKKYDVKINGLHFHLGSDIIQPDVFLLAAKRILELVPSFPHVKFVDFGGGFKVSYKEEDPSFAVEKFGKEVSELFNAACAELGRDLILQFEPGKFFVSECGVMLSLVNVVKKSNGRNFAHLDTGFNHLIRPMYYDAHHEISNLSNPDGEAIKYDIVGYICETDNFAKGRTVAQIRNGDILMFKNAGAYCYSMASNYNSRYRPCEVMVKDGQAFLIRERENIEDLLRGQRRVVDSVNF